MVLVDKITAEGVKYLLNGASEFYKEAGMPGEFDPEFFQNHWEMLISVGVGVVWLAYKIGVQSEKIPVAALGGVIGPDQLNGDLVFTESFFYSRGIGKGNGLKLIQKAEKDLIEAGVKRIYMMNLLYHNAEGAGKLYSLLGYRPAEVLWIKENQNGN